MKTLIKQKVWYTGMVNGKNVYNRLAKSKVLLNFQQNINSRILPLQYLKKLNFLKKKQFNQISAGIFDMLVPVTSLIAHRT